ncbi:aminotransferase class I/II-fold pyridoxal phosphate-dependent enzyme [Arthrobacter sp. PAMC25564]|uniref:aminotransferase class I/II-fold pyridoxal phosphate-dependent enzyme n=1 Tax=Arthrobacter sp. PAMC25564 TaxID=2565366 RepID=UPI0010A25BEF|nr:aminotransferase class I/II-fold pyridoxal phosphate-dependent enzyme [Arthrobacter sp. PAMC25564]QCB96581.1 aminotransferase class I/II-fold pyridoxal phosphate-dependent enzyme [Arthrobacter sp. PAMC25564]
MGIIGESPVSGRSITLASVPSQRRIDTFLRDSVYAWRQNEPDICDFAFGNPHEMPQAAYVEALSDALAPRNEQWFAYKTNEPEAQAAAAASLQRLLGLPFEPADIHLTTGGFTAIPLALKAVADPGDEVIFTLPPWFFYEPLLLEAGLVPVKIRCDAETFDVDLAALGAAITPRTRVVIVNTPNNPTGRIYPPSLLKDLADMLEGASRSNGRRVYLLSDEAYNRIVYDGARFHSPAEYYPYTLLAYTYGKTHLAPGQRIGYVALPPAMPDRGALREALAALQMALGWIYPNALMQYALPRLEQFSIDIGELQRKRDLLVDALTGMGYRLQSPEGSFYLFAHAPIADDEAFVDALAQRGVFVLPGVLFETPGYFRMSLTASEEMIQRSLPVFAEAIAGSGQAKEKAT